jgi:hypothetical protein
MRDIDSLGELLLPPSVPLDGGTMMMMPENLIAFDGARKLVGL